MRFSLKIVFALGFIAFATAQTTEASADPKPTLEAVLASKAPADDKASALLSKDDGNGTVAAITGDDIVANASDSETDKKQPDDIAVPSPAPVDVKPVEVDTTTEKTTTTTTASTTTSAPDTTTTTATTKKPVTRKLIPKKGDNDFKSVVGDAKGALNDAKDKAEEEGEEVKEKVNTAAQVGDVRYAIVAGLITMLATL
uniref:Secreted protein n=1 Tax=Panagrellus redivivus TaxID=6233 RepID=A0A7E4VHW5_PANRE